MSEKMDEDFSYFYNDKGFGPAIASTSVSAESLSKFKGRLPGLLLSYWQQYGWSGYGGGLFWLVDPDEYEPVLEAWIGDLPLVERDAYHVIARTAFGSLFLWGEKSGQSLEISCPWGMIFPRDNSPRVVAGESDFLVGAFLSFQSKADLDQKDYLRKPLFDRALHVLGPLAADEMYGFEPALALGGKAELKALRKVKAVVHLEMLAQLGERQVMRDIVKDANSRGLI